ncbi:MAG: antitoxin, RHH family protein [Candidatus Aminicenantes bacterium]|nr:antitoxin, RHH family protein [Candidatus Aminicenantes bacterium]
MPTKNPRVNVVMEDSLYWTLKELARRDDVSVSMKARDLLKEAVADDEDVFWAEAASEREKTFSVEKALSHKRVWKKK